MASPWGDSEYILVLFFKDVDLFPAQGANLDGKPMYRSERPPLRSERTEDQHSLIPALGCVAARGNRSCTQLLLASYDLASSLGLRVSPFAIPTAALLLSSATVWVPGSLQEVQGVGSGWPLEPEGPILLS